MNRSSIAALAAAALIGSTGIASAQDVQAGAYQLTVGRAAPCVLTLTADGGASVASDCTSIKPAAHWKKTGNLLKLTNAENDTIALLKPARHGYAGITLPEGVQVIATP